jgi:putative DNA methylase
MKTRKKLIEVALPLDAINAASAREKSIRHGHPSTLHLWWARRPLAAARAVIFSQIVDDPSEYVDTLLAVPETRKRAEREWKKRRELWAAKPDDGERGPQPTLADCAADLERERLFEIIRELVKWENTTNEAVLQSARDEIWQSWRRACADNADHPRAKELFDRHKLPAFHDPFAGGGALPLEAQRLGLEAYASDLNPVAVLICKAMIEIPPKFAGKPPINPEWTDKSAAEKALTTWKGAEGLAADVRYYGQWMRDEAEKRIGHLYPRVEVTAEMARERPDLKPLVGQKLTAIAWIWARTVKSPNPAFADVDVPLASTFMLSTKAGKEAYVEPVIETGAHADLAPSAGDLVGQAEVLAGRRDYRFTVRVGKPKELEAAKRGTKSGGSHSSFLCLMSGTPMPFEYLRSESREGRLGNRLMAIVAEGPRGRVYLAPTLEHETTARLGEPERVPELQICHWPGRTNVVEYGLTKFEDLFSDRQLVALTTFSDLVGEARENIRRDAIAAGLPDDAKPLRGGGVGATAYAEGISVYLAFGVDYAANYWSTIATPAEGFIRGTFARQALPMTWDYAEAPPFGNTSGNWCAGIDWISKSLELTPAVGAGIAQQIDASTQSTSFGKIISTDPPYYDNIEYADLSDYFYVWLRRSMQSMLALLFATVAVPKTEELVANPYRQGGKEKAEKFFLLGMTQAIQRLAEQAHPAFPVAIYYAFKQSESESEEGTASTGWETFLDAVIRAGFGLSGTWPIRTERGARAIGIGSNALASSIVLVCRPRSADAATVTRARFRAALRAELPVALRHLQAGNIAPVDLAQAAIGPGMAVYTRYARVLDAEGNPVPVREALALINEVLDEALAEQEGDFDADSRWALAWFEQVGFAEGEYGVADVLSKAKVTTVAGMAHAGIIESGRGKVRLLKPEELSADWDPATHPRLTAWEIVHQLIRALGAGGETAAADLVAKLGTKAESARELAYRLYVIAERKKRASEALAYNGLVQSWPEIARLAQEPGRRPMAEPDLFT